MFSMTVRFADHSNVALNRLAPDVVQRAVPLCVTTVVEVSEGDIRVIDDRAASSLVDLVASQSSPTFLLHLIVLLPGVLHYVQYLCH